MIRVLLVDDEARARLGMLTEREREVIVEVAAGLSNADIGVKLGMAESTVMALVSKSLAKLGTTNRIQAAILVHEAHLDQ